MIEPCFFDNNRLFGSYHPASDQGVPRLLVICPPFFDEYRRCSKALFDLANGCAAEGTHAFRFDYFGTGESWGLLADADVPTWIEDVRKAIQEGMEISGASRVYLCGVRFGATLAAQVQHPAIAEYIFWDMFADGTQYLSYLSEVDADLECQQRETPLYYHPSSEPHPPCELFHLSSALREGMGNLRVDLAALKKRARVHQIVSQKSQAMSEAEDAGFHYEWPHDHDGLLMPKPVLEAVARRLK